MECVYYREVFIMSGWVVSVRFGIGSNMAAAAAKYISCAIYYYYGLDCSISPCYYQLPFSAMIGVMSAKRYHGHSSHSTRITHRKGINRASFRKTKRKFLFFHFFVRFPTLSSCIIVYFLNPPSRQDI